MMSSRWDRIHRNNHILARKGVGEGATCVMDTQEVLGRGVNRFDGTLKEENGGMGG